MQQRIGSPFSNLGDDARSTLKKYHPSAYMVLRGDPELACSKRLEIRTAQGELLAKSTWRTCHSTPIYASNALHYIRGFDNKHVVYHETGSQEAFGPYPNAMGTIRLSDDQVYIVEKTPPKRFMFRHSRIAYHNKIVSEELVGRIVAVNGDGVFSRNKKWFYKNNRPFTERGLLLFEDGVVYPILDPDYRQPLGGFSQEGTRIAQGLDMMISKHPAQGFGSVEIIEAPKDLLLQFVKFLEHTR